MYSVHLRAPADGCLPDGFRQGVLGEPARSPHAPVRASVRTALRTDIVRSHGVEDAQSERGRIGRAAAPHCFDPRTRSPSHQLPRITACAAQIRIPLRARRARRGTRRHRAGDSDRAGGIRGPVHGRAPCAGLAVRRQRGLTDQKERRSRASFIGGLRQRHCAAPPAGSGSESAPGRAGGGQ